MDNNEKYIDLFNPSFFKNDDKTALPSDYSLAMAYIPLQKSIKTYSDEKGLEYGTIFPELNKEFLGKAEKTDEG